jgi:fatty acid desaturase
VSDLRIWRNSPWDALLLTLSVAQLAIMLSLGLVWAHASVFSKLGISVLTTMMMAYNIIVISHLFTHSPWFVSPKLNALVSMLNSVNIGQSVQAYQLTHVRNHHRYNNDPKGPDGTTKDLTSTYRDGKDGEHTPVLRYMIFGAAESLLGRAQQMLMVIRLWRVGPKETSLLTLASARDPRRSRELRQIQADRIAVTLSLVLFFGLSWKWALLCYLPAFFAALALVNVQNYYRHYGAQPASRAADSVSHYGRLYNLLAFNDGFHQEHHLNPGAHWSELPQVQDRRREMLDERPRIISPVPAMVGFLDRGRPLLHRDDAYAKRVS